MHLLRTPHAYTRLTSEIRTAFPTSPQNMKFTQLAELPYMNACIDEALRIFPPVPTGLTRTVPSGGDTVSGHFIPEEAPERVVEELRGWLSPREH